MRRGQLLVITKLPMLHWLMTTGKHDSKPSQSEAYRDLQLFKKLLTYWRQFGAIHAERHHHGQG